jgi:hypothetical protein
MSIKTWVTQPPQKFDSFYYYDTVNLNFVRIRLELGRNDLPPYEPNPGVFPEQNRFVGFVENLHVYDFDNTDLWTVNAAHAIVYKAGKKEEQVLSQQPAPGKSTVDFSLEAGHIHPGFIHYGNPLVDQNKARLPFNSEGKPVTLAMLQTIAEKMAHHSDGIDLGDSHESEHQLGDKIFQLYKILTGNITKNVKPFATQLQEANDYFNNKNLPAVATYADKDNPYADKDGLIEFIIGNELVDDEKVMNKLETLKGYLVSLTSVVTDYVNRYAQANGEQYKTDADLWAEAMSMLPLMGPGKIDTQSYSRHIKGVTIATEFVQFLLDIVAQDGSAALNKFSDFLEKQGEALKFGVEHNDDYYNTISIGVSIEVMKIGKKIIYVPKIKQYKVKFDRENSKWSGACISYEYVDINFDYLYAANVFDYEALNDKDTKEEFENFIKGAQKAQIDKASTYFNNNFLPKKPKLRKMLVR